MFHSTCVDLLPKKVLLGGSGILMYIGLKLVSKNKTAFLVIRRMQLFHNCAFSTLIMPSLCDDLDNLSY